MQAREEKRRGSMSSSKMGIEAEMEKHGTAIDGDKQRVKCNYCEKEVNGFNRLKHHLGGVGGDVVSCPLVPPNTKLLLKDSLVEKKKQRLRKEVGQLCHPDLPLKRHPSSPLSPLTAAKRVANNSPSPSPSVATKRSAAANSSSSPPSAATKRSAAANSSSSAPSAATKRSAAANSPSPLPAAATKRSAAANSTSPPPSAATKRATNNSPCTTAATKRSAAGPSNHATTATAPKTVRRNDNDRSQPSSSIPPARNSDADVGLFLAGNKLEKAVGGFFLESGIDPDMLKLPSFKQMIDVAVNCGAGHIIPSPDVITGRILQDEVREIVGRINGMRECWEDTGCTLLLDSWVDKGGRSLIGFVVHCAKGCVFLRSIDVSDVVEDVDELFVLLAKVIREVGVENVVQVITTNVTPHMQAVGQRLTDKFSVHFNLCADFCMDLILGKIAEMGHVTQVLTTAKSITRLIYSNEGPLQLLHKHLKGADLLSPSHWRNVARFRTLGNLVSNKGNLLKMLNSHEWTTIEWAYGPDTRNMIEQVKKDSSFWTAASNVVKVTNPLVGVLDRIFGVDKTAMGCLYNEMDCAKEKIRIGLGGDEEIFGPYWDVIDDIWDNYLHTSIHAAGYYLNPALFYSKEFDADQEVVNGLHDCNLLMGKDLTESKKISKQIDTYQRREADFSDFAATIQAKTLPPVRWWRMNGGLCQQLQKFAIRVLSQPVCGAPRYNLDHAISEELHSFKGTIVHKHLLRDREFVRNNRILESSDVAHATPYNMLNTLNDWVSP